MINKLYRTIATFCTDFENHRFVAFLEFLLFGAFGGELQCTLKGKDTVYSHLSMLQAD